MLEEIVLAVGAALALCMVLDAPDAGADAVGVSVDDTVGIALVAVLIGLGAAVAVCIGTLDGSAPVVTTLGVGILGGELLTTDRVVLAGGVLDATLADGTL